MSLKQSATQQQTQTQTQAQVQNLTPQQVLFVRLLELPVEALKERVAKEMEENPYLEVTTPTEGDTDFAEGTADAPKQDQAGNDDSIYDYVSPDDVPDYLLRTHNQGDQAGDVEYGDTQSFYDQLMEQVGEYDLDARQRQMLEYVVGSLDDDGLLRKPLSTLAYELDTWHELPCTVAELEDVLHILWRFDPPGVGGRSLQECLLIQVRRQRKGPMRDLMMEVLDRMWSEFERKRWDHIQRRLHLDDLQVDALKAEIRHLNPRPGSAMGERIGMGSPHITPDFVVETDSYGEITMHLNTGDVPEMRISEDVEEELRAAEKLRPADLTADLRFKQTYAERGRAFIEALGQRRRSMLLTMKWLIQLQRPFFLEGDESLLRPMKLDDIAQKTGLDISTVSRVCNGKYVQTSYGTYPLKWFFSSGSTQDGEDVSTRKLKIALRELIEKEPAGHPLTDEALTRAMREAGYNLARRTVAKYREELGIPVARLRK